MPDPARARTRCPFWWLAGLLLAGLIADPAEAQQAGNGPLDGRALRVLLLYGADEFSSFPSSRPNEARQAPLHKPTLAADRPRDPWLARDKALHVAFSALWTLSTQYAFVNKMNWSERRALPVSAGVSGTIGLAKEVYDWRHSPTRYFSKRDLAADAVGIALAAGFILL